MTYDDGKDQVLEGSHIIKYLKSLLTAEKRR